MSAANDKVNIKSAYLSVKDYKDQEEEQWVITMKGILQEKTELKENEQITLDLDGEDFSVLPIEASFALRVFVPMTLNDD